MIRSFHVGLQREFASEATTVALVKHQIDNGFEEATFAYGRKYLASEGAIPLNPGCLPLSAASVTTSKTKPRDGGGLHLTLKDALPDNWGRLVLQARYGTQISEIDMLLQTNADRVGAMVFAEDREKLPLLDLTIESFTVEALADAAQRLELDMEITPEIRRLLRQGGSLGGARPKASVLIEDQLWLAKFPAKDDEVDVQMLEACTLTLAQHCGIAVPEFRLHHLGKSTALLLRRFDRPGSASVGQRLHFLSAAAFTDSPYETSTGSYTKLAQHLRMYGCLIKNDLKELFRRMVSTSSSTTRMTT